MYNQYSKIINFYHKIIIIIFKILIIIIPLYAYKYVYELRINQIMVLKLFTLIALTLWIINIISKEKYVWYSTKINISISLFILILTISLFRSNNFYVSFNDYLIFLAYFILYFLVINNVENKKELNSFVKFFFITSFLVSIYTILHYYGIIPYLKEFGPVVSPIGQKNMTSNYLTLIFPIIFSFFLLEQIRKNKISYFLLLSIIYTTLMICQSRGIWISISVALILAFYIIFKFNLLKLFQNNKKWLFLLLLTFLIITIIYSTDNPLNKSAMTVPQRALSTFNEQDPSINTRLLIWNNTFDMIKEKPILGFGIGTFKMNYLNYQAEHLKDNPYYAKYYSNARETHNEYLQIGVELGVAGLGIFLLFFFIFFIMIIKYFNQEKNDRKKLIVFGLSLGIICFLIHSLFTFPLHVPALGSAFFIIVSLTIVYIKNNDPSYPDKKINRLKIINSKPKIIIIAIILFISCFLIFYFVIKPYIAELAYFKGMKYIQKNDCNSALQKFEYATKYDPYNGRILHALGSTYYNLGIFDRAENNLRNSLNYSIDVKTYYNLGLVYLQTRFYKKAEENFKHTIYLDSKYTKAYLNLAYIYAKQDNFDKAIVEWNKILEIEPNFTNKYIILNNLGIVYNKKEMPDKAFEYFLEALQLAPEDSPIIEEIEKEIYNIYKVKLDN
jgi:O-antigen ligase/Tfp pilus assembly protein PilF